MIIPIPLSNQESFEQVAKTINMQGFALIKVPSLISPVVSTIFKTAPEFFSLSVKEKKRNSFLNLTSGYRNIGSEFSKSIKRSDLFESFSYIPTEEDDFDDKIYKPAMILHTLLKNYACLVQPLIKRIITQLAQIYGQASDQQSLSSGKYSPTQLNYYEPFMHHRHLLVDTHEDGGLITALIVNNPGLEIRTRKREYVSINSSLDTIILMAGETLSLLTGYSIEPIHHRVRRYKEQKSRISLTYFANVNIDINIRPWVVNKRNTNVDIVEQAVNNPIKYGLPPLRRR